jgi:hypothetical protein
MCCYVDVVVVTRGITLGYRVRQRKIYQITVCRLTFD